VQHGHATGRWPANIIHDGSDDVVALFPAGKARFFYCAKASRRERNSGCEDLEKKINPGWGKNGYSRPTEQPDRQPTPKANHHPTVKPLALMRYLCRLTRTPTGGVVLDPYLGSGTTAVAAILEDRSYIGIEREAQYVEIARRRVAHAAGEDEPLADGAINQQLRLW
jgi:site-specific DNA-methyltransferase (adenine-specific)